MPHFDVFQIPSRQTVGRLLETCKGIPIIAKFIRVRRKKFIGKIKSSERDSLVKAVCKSSSGQTLNALIAAWLHEPAPPSIAATPLVRSELASKRCSVVINSVDRANELEQTLNDLSLVWDAMQDELIIVLGPSSDQSKEVIRNAGMDCRLIECPEKNLAVSRNLGWQAARGHFVAYIDDDASPAEGWLDALLEPLLQDPNTGVSAGFIMDGARKRYLNRYVVADALGRAYEFEDAAGAEEKILELGAERSFLTAMGCNMAFPRSVLDTLGGFDPFYAYFLEETDVVFRIISAGYRCESAPNSRVFHRLASNPIRKPSIEIKNRIVVIRSQIHYINKFGKGVVALDIIKKCLWERILLDLEKIAWESGSHKICGQLQIEYLEAVANEFKLSRILKDTIKSSHQ